MTTNCSILIIDDEVQIRKLLKMNLEASDYKVIEAETGNIGLQMALSYNPDLIILDLGLPDISGQIVLKKIRKWYQKSIIILTVLNDEAQIITALDHGATDYLTKPFRSGELMARIRSNINRQNLFDFQHRKVSEFDDLSIDYAAHLVKKKDNVIKLTAIEHNLLALFMKNEGRVLTHHFLLKEIWGVGHQTDTQYLRVFIANLRKKIEDNPNKPVHIITESGIGYRFQ